VESVARYEVTTATACTSISVWGLASAVMLMMALAAKLSPNVSLRMAMNGFE